MSDTFIRQANEADVSSVCQLQQQWFEEGSVHGFMPDGQEHVQAALGPYFLVAQVDDTLVGFISGSVHVSEGTAVIPEGQSYIEIDSLSVSPQFRKQGIGSQLLNRVLGLAKQQGVSHSLLYSATKDIHSVIRFYEQHKFQSWYVQMFQKL